MLSVRYSTIKSERGFTLIELVVVLAILGIISSIIISNFGSSFKKGRDSKRKQDIQTVQKALELYYADNQSYPQSPSGGVAFPVSGYPDLCHPTGGCNTAIYMKNLPSDPSANFNYFYKSDSKTYQLYSCLENDQDIGPGVKLLNGAQDTSNGYPGTTCGSCKCMFGVSSPNTTP